VDMWWTVVVVPVSRRRRKERTGGRGWGARGGARGGAEEHMPVHVLPQASRPAPARRDSRVATRTTTCLTQIPLHSNHTRSPAAARHGTEPRWQWQGRQERGEPAAGAGEAWTNGCSGPDAGRVLCRLSRFRRLALLQSGADCRHELPFRLAASACRRTSPPCVLSSGRGWGRAPAAAEAPAAAVPARSGFGRAASGCGGFASAKGLQPVRLGWMFSCSGWKNSVL